MSWTQQMLSFTWKLSDSCNWLFVTQWQRCQRRQAGRQVDLQAGRQAGRWDTHPSGQLTNRQHRNNLKKQSAQFLRFFLNLCNFAVVRIGMLTTSRSQNRNSASEWLKVIAGALCWNICCLSHYPVNSRIMWLINTTLVVWRHNCRKEMCLLLIL